MTRMPPPMSVALFYALFAHDGRAILRETKWCEPLFWIIRTKVAGRWEYALIGDDGTQKHVIPTLDITVVEARLPRFFGRLRKNPVDSLVIH